MLSTVHPPLSQRQGRKLLRLPLCCWLLVLFSVILFDSIPVATSFATSEPAVRVRSIPKATSHPHPTAGFSAHSSFHHPRDRKKRGNDRITGRKFSARKGNRFHSMALGMGSSGTSRQKSSYLAKLRVLRRKFRTRRKRNHRNTPNNNNDRDPLDRVRFLHDLPLGNACLVLAAYLTVGVLAFRYSPWFREPSWTVVDALYFSTACLSTIGYGDLVPTHAASKLFAALFGASGILLWSSAIATVGTKLVQSETRNADAALRKQERNGLVEFFETHLADRLSSKNDSESSATARWKGTTHATNGSVSGDQAKNEEKAVTTTTSSTGKATSPTASNDKTKQRIQNGMPSLHWKYLLRSLAKPLLVIVSGGTLMGKLEGWNLVDSVYFSLVTATTIGFGDFRPSTTVGKLACTVLIPIMVGAAASVVASLGLFAVRTRTARLFASRRERAEWLTPSRAKAMDLDGTGRVSKSEYVLYLLVETGTVDPDEVAVLEDQFERFDVTRSGYIEAGDLAAMQGLRDKLRKRHHRGV